MSNPTIDAGDLVHLLNHLQRIGITHLPRHDPVAVEHISADLFANGAVTDDQVNQSSSNTNLDSIPPARSALAKPTKQVPEAVPNRWQQPVIPIAERQRLLSHLAGQVAVCTRCPELSCQRHHTVFGEGNPQPRVCFFGEAPGADEDRTGRPFVGAAGQLLDRIIGACKFKREDVYILNTVKCRPPLNRNPTDLEIENCREYFLAQLELLQPEYLVCLGLVAAKALFPSAPAIGQLRGRFHAYRGAKVVVTYHPAYLLRNSSVKAAVWEDMKMMLREMGGQV